MFIRAVARRIGALVFAVALLPQARLAAQEGRIEGIVVVGDAIVDDADVVIPGLGRRVRVDRGGRFAFEDVPPGTYVLEAQSVRWGRGVESVELAAGSTAQARIVVEAIFHLDELVVSAGAGSTRRSEAYQPASVMTSRDIVASGEASLGETLSREPGVSSTYFGPGASRPVIRGIGGDRVRILEGGVGVGDASSTSPDHAVAIEARSADRIEVIRGPATLLYGSSAVGGVVNVLDGKIAREPPTRPFTGYAEVLGGSVADERTGSGGFTLRTGPVVLTGSGLWRDAGDYSIPGIAELAPDPDEEVEAGVLENSALESRRGSAGLTLVGDRGHLGVAFTAQRSNYGVPGHEHEEEGSALPGDAHEAGVTIDLDQNRVDAEGALRFGAGAFRNLKGRFGYSDYTHVELEGDAIGTTFFNDFAEGRLESEHSFSSWSQGSFGAQFATRDFEAIGDEAFVPPSTTTMVALFGYEDFGLSESFRVQTGLRYERQKAESPTTAVDRSDDAVSASLGFNWDALSSLSLSASASRSVKLPNAEELFSDGPHAATSSFEIGDPDLVPETALGVDVTAHLHTDRIRGSASFFSTGFSDYIYESATGSTRDDLVEYVYAQGDARFTGIEIEGEFDVIEGDASSGAPHLSLEAMGDFVKAELVDTGEPLPRIPAMRFGGGVNYRQGPFVVRSGVRHTARQSDVAPFETVTEGFTMVDASISYRLFTGGFFHDITLTGSNLTNAEARLHTSFLKDLAPLPGREIRLVYRLNFGG